MFHLKKVKKLVRLVVLVRSPLEIERVPPTAADTPPSEKQTGEQRVSSISKLEIPMFCKISKFRNCVRTKSCGASSLMMNHFLWWCESFSLEDISDKTLTSAKNMMLHFQPRALDYFRYRLQMTGMVV